MARCAVFIDAGFPVGETLPDDLVGRRFDGEADTIDAAIDAIPEPLRGFVAEAEREARKSPDGDGLVDHQSSGWWASATL